MHVCVQNTLIVLFFCMTSGCVIGLARELWDKVILRTSYTAGWDELAALAVCCVLSASGVFWPETMFYVAAWILIVVCAALGALATYCHIDSIVADLRDFIMRFRDLEKKNRFRY